MTTRVLIVNHGPDPLVVHTQGKKDAKGFAPSSSSDVVAPQSHAEFYVHGGQDLLIEEREHGG